MFNFHCETLVDFLCFVICCNCKYKSFSGSLWFSFFLFFFFCIYLNIRTQMTIISLNYMNMYLHSLVFKDTFKVVLWHFSSLQKKWHYKVMQVLLITFDNLQSSLSSYSAPFCAIIPITMPGYLGHHCLVTWYPNIRQIYNAHNSDICIFCSSIQISFPPLSYSKFSNAWSLSLVHAASK